MCLSGRNPRMRPEASRTVCGKWAQSTQFGFCVSEIRCKLSWGSEGWRGRLIDRLGALNQEPDPMFQGPPSETVNPENPVSRKGA